MVQMVLFCPLFEGSGAGSAVRGLVPVFSGRVAWRSEPFTSVGANTVLQQQDFDPTEQGDFGHRP